MFKLANQILDAYDDVNKIHLRKVAKLNPKIYMMTPEERNGLGDDDFALSVITKKANKLNKFPVDSKDNTWLSNQYFELTHPGMPKTAAAIAAYNISKACEQFGLKETPAVAALKKEASSNVYCEENLKVSDQAITPRILDMTKFAQVEQICDNYTFAQYAFPTPSHIKLACQYFEKHAAKIPLELRSKYAGAIQKRAKELGLGQQRGFVSKYASDYYSAHVDAHLRSRASLLESSDPKYRSALDKLATMKNAMTPQEFAGVLFAFDKRAGLSKYYDGGIQDPFTSTFAAEIPNPGTIKSASSGMSPDDIKKVASAKYDKIKEYFGKNVADSLRSDGVDIFDSLPIDAKEVIAGIANGTL